MIMKHYLDPADSYIFGNFTMVVCSAITLFCLLIIPLDLFIVSKVISNYLIEKGGQYSFYK